MSFEKNHLECLVNFERSSSMTYEEEPKQNIKIIKVKKFKCRYHSGESRMNLRYALTPQDIKDTHTPYKLSAMPPGIYAWIQLAKTKKIRKIKFEEGTLVAWQKNTDDSAHATLLTSQLGLTSDHVKSAGVLVVDKTLTIALWNLRSGFYKTSKQLDEDDRELLVGLPLNLFDKSTAQEKSSPTVSQSLIFRFQLEFPESKSTKNYQVCSENFFYRESRITKTTKKITTHDEVFDTTCDCPIL